MKRLGDKLDETIVQVREKKRKRRGSAIAQEQQDCGRTAWTKTETMLSIRNCRKYVGELWDGSAS